MEEFLKQLLARQQREREDLENRHRRELECLRQRLRSCTVGGSSAAWPLCEGAAPNGAPGPPSRLLPHSQSAPHFPRPLLPLPLSPSPDWHMHHHYPHLHGGGSPPLNLPASLERGLHRSNSEGISPDPLTARPVARTRTLTDDLLRLVQLNGAARTCPPTSLSPEPKPTLHQLMQQRHVVAPPLGSPLKEGPPSPVTSPPPMYPPPHHLQFGSGGPRGMHRHQ